MGTAWLRGRLSVCAAYTVWSLPRHSSERVTHWRTGGQEDSLCGEMSSLECSLEVMEQPAERVKFQMEVHSHKCQPQELLLGRETAYTVGSLPRHSSE